MRLNNLFSPSPKLIGVTYNGKLLCGGTYLQIYMSSLVPCKNSHN